MAMQQLTQPIVNPIAAFDATMPQAITFLVIGGTQVVGNRIVISDNQTGNVVYNNIVNTMKLAHTIPANTLSNGGYYNVVIYTIDNSANESAPSTPVPFYCYSQPTLTITNSTPEFFTAFQSIVPRSFCQCDTSIPLRIAVYPSRGFPFV